MCVFIIIIFIIFFYIIITNTNRCTMDQELKRIQRTNDVTRAWQAIGQPVTSNRIVPPPEKSPTEIFYREID